MSQTQTPDQERRRYFRIDDEVALTLKPVPAEEEARAVERFQDASQHFGLLNDLRAVRTEHLPLRRQLQHRHGAMMSYIGVLERQLELLAMALDAHWNGPQLPNALVNLSAQGLRCNSELALTPGDLVEIWLMLFPEHSRIYALGRVVSVEETGENGDGIAIDFAHLREADQEAIAQHVHQLQIQRLRAENDYE
ncbi:MAG: PilZ domain-containing protein, partial [Chromatiaceae bacterium]|nr:PilZ domain-containing protein [Chromatiaceae bacterium]